MRGTLLLLALAACSATATPRSLARAEQLEHAGRDDEAARAYDEAAASECAGSARRARWCAAALQGQAAALARTGRKAEAAAAYEKIPAQLPEASDDGAAALVAAAGLRLELGEDARGYDLYWRVLIDYPGSSAADDALRNVVADGRRRDARQLYGALRDLYTRLFATPVGDNLLWAMATLAHEDLHDEGAALDACDRLPAAHKDSPLVDDARWLGAELARKKGDPKGAETRLRALLATREQSLIIGSYHSIYLDDAQLALGLLLRDDLGRPRDAIEELGRLSRDYPESVLRDDALYEAAATYEALGDAKEACRVLGLLRQRHKESKYEVEKAPAARKRLGCS